jgi:hypothetical protein
MQEEGKACVMRKFFKGISEKASDGWMLAVVTGNSNVDGKDWIIDTNSLHADQVPESCTDAALFAKLVAGLLNCFYNNIETKPLSAEQIIELGTVVEEEKIPHPSNPELPF